MTRRIALFVEGDTERGTAKAKTLPPFFHRWLDPQLPERKRVGISAVKFNGVSQYLDDVGQKVEMYIEDRRADVVFGLIDLYGIPTTRIDLSACGSVIDRIAKVRSYVKGLVASKYHGRFRQHFAVHEVEAWLLAYPEHFPAHVRMQIQKRAPEAVNLNEPPAKFLQRILGGRYKKTVHARNVFPTVDPNIAIAKCPNLRILADDLLRAAKAYRID